MRERTPPAPRFLNANENHSHNGVLPHHHTTTPARARARRVE